MKRYWTVVKRPAGGWQIGWLDRGRVEVLALESMRYDTYEQAAAAAKARNDAGVQRSLLRLSRSGGAGNIPAPEPGRHRAFI